ncbi:TonB-dependent receptor [Granulicella tundricola]|uniref:TonB-dependent receptor plug n=1 Tax=Granulicella tundricola (strain ATCC BAA-1859 / DSM 23138 / MP5ACTX9) TaxID=1198114 RepID=E8X6L5_GRATM|nr:carboxypeptidase-like regulatory domain-containing protein [Granulicella tundricola]ADW71165.1 TonB-dependent receptor plug [Granulicella tundricola MP5ACTX9]
MNRHISGFLCSVSAVAAMGAGIGAAQTVTGTVTGMVTDPSGAVIPNAMVVAHNVDTGVDSNAKTDSAGLYRIAFLPIGHYTVAISGSGFGTQNVPQFTLEALQTTTFNVKLALGSSETTVNVSEASEILDTNDATLSGTFTANTIQNFPLNGLDFSALTLYLPGSVSTSGTGGTTSIERSLNNSDTVNLNGNRAQANNFTLDGIDDNETFNNLIAYSPAPESLQEIKVLTANSPADYGNVNGGGIVSILKSGTNTFHGSAYGYVQDYRTNANSYNNKHVTPVISTNPYSQAQFGGTFGGPIKRDKLFFFVDYLGSRYHRGGTGTASVFTQAMRNGDFSALLNTAGATPIQLYDSVNNYAPFVGNRGVAVINPVAKYLFAHPELYPLPNATPDPDTVLNNNFQGPIRTYRANNQGDIKIEYDPRSADKITGFYAMSTAYDGSTALLPVTFPSVSIFPTRLFGATWVHIFSPSIVNSARAGFTRTDWNQGLPLDPSGVFGTRGNSIVGIPFPNQAYNGFSAQNIGGLSGVGTGAFDGGLIDNTFSYVDNITWQRGTHTITAGIQALRYQNNYPTSNNNGYLGNIGYGGAFTSNPNLSNAPGYGGADFLLDRVSSAAVTLGSVNVGQRQWRTAGFVSDDFKAMPNLTINFGIRYEYDQPWIESNNKTGNVDIATGQVLYAGRVPVGAPAGSGVCSTRACYDGNHTQIMPRLGFSYQANSRFVIRGGYGATSFYEGNSSNQRLTSITPFIQAVNVTVVTPTVGNPGAPRTAEQGFTGGTTAYGGTFNVYPKNIQPAYVQEYNLTAEYAMTRSLSLQVGYLGEGGQHIEDYGNLNQYKVNGDETSAPYYNNKYIGINAVDPSISIGSNSLLITESRATMNYNALQAVLRQRTTHGLEFTLNYTYGKALTNSLGNYGLNVNGFSGAFQNYYDSGADWGPAGYDVRHNFSGNGVYALPIGRGRDYLSHVNRFVDEAIGGWKLAVAAVAYTGFPETLTGPGNNSNSYGSSRPNQYRALKIVNRTLENYFGTDPSAIPCTTPGVDNGVCAFGTPANNSFGTARNGNVRGPGYLNVDMSAFKDFHTFREQTIGFRFDAFNAFNITSYGNPDSGITDSTFGNVSNQGVRSVERHLQFSGSYRF